MQKTIKSCLLLHAVGSESQISVNQETQCQRNSQISVGGGGGKHAQKPKFRDEKNCIRHFTRFNFSRLSLAFILKYYPS